MRATKRSSTHIKDYGARVKTYLINMDLAVERLRFVDDQLRRLGVVYERFPAITPASMPERMSLRFHPRAHELLLPGEIACFASHLSVAERLLDSDAPCCLVLEDDVEFECSREELQSFAEQSANYDMLQLSRNSERPALVICDLQGRKIVRYLDPPYAGGAYFLSRRGARRMLRHAVGLAIPFDIFFRSEAFLHLDIASVTPAPVPQDRFGASDIDAAAQRGAKALRKMRRRCFYESTVRARKTRRVWRAAQGVGLANYIRMKLMRFGMKLLGRHRLTAAPLLMRRWPQRKPQ